jgi:hypothetical protein
VLEVSRKQTSSSGEQGEILQVMLFLAQILMAHWARLRIEIPGAQSGLGCHDESKGWRHQEIVTGLGRWHLE